MSTISIAKVFVNEQGKFGNPVGVVIDDQGKLNHTERQKIAAQLNFSETVFVNDLEHPNISFYNPVHEVRFAGHATLGTIYFLKHTLRKKFDSIKCGGMDVNITTDGKLTFVEAPLSIMPPWNFKQLDTSKDVEKLTKEEFANQKHIVVWAWLNKSKNLIRARTFAPDWGIPEDEANGSGSMLLANQLNKSLKIIHGQGSEIYAQPITNNVVKLGGLVSLEKTKSL